MPLPEVEPTWVWPSVAGEGGHAICGPTIERWEGRRATVQRIVDKQDEAGTPLSDEDQKALLRLAGAML